MERVFHDVAHDFHLSFASVCDDEVGQGGLLLDETAVTAFHHFGHRGVVIGADDGLDVVFPIIVLAGLGFLEHDAAGHGIRALDVGIVETFDGEGQLGESEFSLQLFQQVHAALLGIESFGLLHLVELVLSHIGQGEIQQVFLFSTLRDGDGDVFQLGLNRKWYDDFAGVALVALPHLYDAQGQHVFGCFVDFLLELEGERLVDAAVGDVEIVDVGGFLFVRNAENVDVVVVVGDDFAPFDKFAGQVVFPF